MTSAWNRLRDHPPILVRLYARTGWGRRTRSLSCAEIAIISDIPLARVQEISLLFDWDGLTIGEAKGFCAACGFDPMDIRSSLRQRDLQKKCKMRHPQPRLPHFLSASPHLETELLPLISRLKSRATSLAA